MSTKADSFFRVFDFYDMMHDAIDKGIVYEGITITKDIQFASGKKLVVGKGYDAVWFLFKSGVFQFIDWVEDPDDKGNYIPDPETFIEVDHMVMSKFLVW